MTEPPEDGPPRKYYVDNGVIEIAHEVVSELDADGKKLRIIRYTDYTAEQVRTLYASAADLWKQWQLPKQRDAIIGSSKNEESISTI